jgi:hypothetical protein
VVAQAPARTGAAHGQPHAAATRVVVARARIGALAPAAVLAGGVVAVVAQAEEPDQPDDE